MHPLTKTLAAELDSQYVKKRFPRGCAGAYDAQDGSPVIHFFIYAFQEDLCNNRYLAVDGSLRLGRFGRWIASWELGRETGQLKGKVLVEYTCREEANLHYTQEMDYYAETDEIGDTDKTIAFIIQHVAIAGNKVQGALVEQQEAFYTEGFKRLRRSLPITRTKMDWYPRFSAVCV